MLDLKQNASEERHGIDSGIRMKAEGLQADPFEQSVLMRW